MSKHNPRCVTFFWVVIQNDRNGMERYGANVEAGVTKAGCPVLRVVSSPDNANLKGMTIKDDKFSMCKGLFSTTWNRLREHDAKRTGTTNSGVNVSSGDRLPKESERVR